MSPNPRTRWPPPCQSSSPMSRDPRFRADRARKVQQIGGCATFLAALSAIELFPAPVTWRFARTACAGEADAVPRCRATPDLLHSGRGKCMRLGVARHSGRTARPVELRSTPRPGIIRMPRARRGRNWSPDVARPPISCRSCPQSAANRGLRDILKTSVEDATVAYALPSLNPFRLRYELFGSNANSTNFRKRAPCFSHISDEITHHKNSR